MVILENKHVEFFNKTYLFRNLVFQVTPYSIDLYLCVKINLDNTTTTTTTTTNNNNNNNITCICIDCTLLQISHTRRSYTLQWSGRRIGTRSWRSQYLGLDKTLAVRPGQENKN